MRRLDSFLHRLSEWSVKRWLLIVLAVALVERAVLVLLYSPVDYGDTKAYRRLAEAILKGWKWYDGTRTPGYPLFLAVFQSDASARAAQLVLGIATTLLVFMVAWKISGRAWFGGAAALAHTLNIAQLFFESSILSETVTTFWVILALAGAIFGLYYVQGNRGYLLAAGIGLASGLALITRAMFIYLPFWIVLLLPMWGRPVWPASLKEYMAGFNRIFWLRAAALLLPVGIILGSWVGFIHSMHGDWAMDTMTGYRLVQHTGAFFELVPDQYADLRDTYIRYRSEHIAQYGTQTNTIWDAIPEMQRVSGMTFFDLSRTLARISIQLIKAHPDLYLRSAAEGWWLFWRAPVYWSPEAVRWSGIVPALAAFTFIERLVLFAGNLFFLASTLAALVWPGLRRLLFPPETAVPLFFLVGMIWAGSLLQTFMDHGDNPRFLIPMQTLVVVWVLWVGYQAAGYFLARMGKVSKDAELAC